MKLTEENYFSVEASKAYCSKSQLMTFLECEERALAEMRGEYIRESTDSMLLGSYVDCKLLTPNELPQFISKHPELFKKDGELYAKYAIGDVMVERCKRDKNFMKMLEGEHQKIMVGEIFGTPFKIKIDVLHPSRIVDLKTTADITKETYSKKLQKYINPFELFRYDIQGAIYQEVVRQNIGKTLPFYLNVVTSQQHPRIKVVQIDQDSIDAVWQDEEICGMIQNIPLLKSGEIKPNRCEKCDYCADTEVITHVEDWLGREVFDGE